MQQPKSNVDEAKGEEDFDWRTLPTTSWFSLHSKFECVKVDEILNTMPRAELLPVWRHLRRCGPSAKLADSTLRMFDTSGINLREIEQLRQVLRAALQRGLLKVCKYSHELDPFSGSVGA